MPSIIVIGNGPSVMENEYGEIIDQFDCVIRINQYRPTFEKWLGKKLDIFITTDYNASIVFRKETPNVGQIIKESERIIVWNDVGYDTIFDDLDKTTIIQKDVPTNGKTVCQNEISHTLIEKHDFNGFHKGTWPSTGVNILMYLIQSGNYDKIYIYGFDGLKNNEKMHYYENLVRTTHEHSPKKEIDFVEHYIAEGILERLEESDYVL